jgi:hypothetical protein
MAFGVYPRRRPLEAFAVGRLDFLEAFAAFDLFDPASERLSG